MAEAGSTPAEASIERLDLDDRAAVIAADPQNGPPAALFDKDAADVGRPRQLIFHDGVRRWIEPRHAIAHHRARPDLATPGPDDVVWIAPRCGQLPFLDDIRPGVEAADGVAA